MRYAARALFVMSILSGAVVFAAPGAGAAAPVVTVAPSGPFTSGQTVSITVGPNGYFTPHSRVNVLECSDPGGSTANLPKDVTTCDGDTIQGDSILVTSDGSFSDKSYPIYSTPNAVLGEQPNGQPVCNQTNACVLYIGQDQNDFTAPKVFSSSFLVTPSASSGSTAQSASSAGATTATTAATPTTVTASAGVALAAGNASATGSLADTGPSAELLWLLGGGAVLFLTGVVGRRRVLRGIR